MRTVETQEQIRRAYYLEHKSKRRIASELNIARDTVAKALTAAAAPHYTLQQPRPAPKLGPFKALIDQLLAERAQMPRKQRYTSHKIFERLKADGYQGSEPSVRGYIARQQRQQDRPRVFLPLAYEPGVDAQVDWGEAEATIAGVRRTVQLFVMRLCCSRRIFVMAFPTQKQESFFAGHVQAFHYFGGAPQRLTYDNLATAVLQVLKGRNRREQESFIAFRSHYLFASQFCTPGQGHEKGGVEHGVGYARRNFMVPIPEVDSYETLNAELLAACWKDDARRPDGLKVSITEIFSSEVRYLLPMPKHDFPCCATVNVSLNPYSQITFETNRYSVPVDEARRTLVLKAYPFRLDILDGEKVIAGHERCYERQQDIFDPLHYLPLLEQRPRAFDQAKPLRLWREKWPENYEKLLAELQAERPEGEGVREFVRILNLHRLHPTEQVEQAIAQALNFGCIHLDGVQLCLNQLQTVELPATLDLSQQPRLSQVGQQPLNLRAYDELLDSRVPAAVETESA